MNRKKQNSKTDEIYMAEKKLVSLYKNLEDMIENVEMYIEQSSKKIKDERQESEKILAKMEETYAKLQEQSKNNTKLELQAQESLDRKNKAVKNITDNANTVYETAKVKQVEKRVEKQVEKEKQQQLEQQKRVNKVSLVRNFHSQGMNTKQISQKMGISQGEVNLIMGIRK